MEPTPCSEQRLTTSTLSRHRHSQGYAAIVLEGGYVEAGDLGCWRAAAGDVLAHGPFEAHLNAVAAGGATVLNLPLPDGMRLPPVFRVKDADALIRLARRDAQAAAAYLEVDAVVSPMLRDWADHLAAALRCDPALRIGTWAHQVRLAPATVSRGFKARYGATPARYRAEVRALLAWRRIEQGQDGLAAIAADCGFADQAHLTRATTALTGAPPAAWRKVKTVQDRAAARA